MSPDNSFDQITRDLLDGTLGSLDTVDRSITRLLGPELLGRLRDPQVVEQASRGGRALDELADEIEKTMRSVRDRALGSKGRLIGAQVIHPVIETRKAS